MPPVSGRIALCICGKKGENRYSLDGVAPLRQASRRSRNRPRVVARAHSDWELVVVAQELLYRLADMFSVSDQVDSYKTARKDFKLHLPTCLQGRLQR